MKIRKAQAETLSWLARTPVAQTGTGNLKKIDDAADYHLYSSAYDGRDWTWYRPLVADCIRYCLPGRIVDLGCGSGLMVECASRYGLDMIGIDGSDLAIAAGKRRMPELNLSRHDLRGPLPFEDESLQGIICHQLIEHLSPESCLHLFKECLRVLSREGVFLVYSPSCFNEKETRDHCHINLYSPARLARELKSAGFEVLQVVATPTLPWPGGRVGNALARLLYRYGGFRSLASSANAVARKTC